MRKILYPVKKHHNNYSTSRITSRIVNKTNSQILLSFNVSSNHPFYLHGLRIDRCDGGQPGNSNICYLKNKVQQFSHVRLYTNNVVIV